VVVLVDIKFLLDFVDAAHCDLTGEVEAVRDFKRVNAFLQKFLGLLEDCTCQHNHSGRAVSNLIVLRG